MHSKKKMMGFSWAEGWYRAFPGTGQKKTPLPWRGRGEKSKEGTGNQRAFRLRSSIDISGFSKAREMKFSMKLCKRCRDSGVAKSVR